MLELLLVRQEEMEQQTGTEGNVKPIGFILMRMMVIASEEWRAARLMSALSVMMRYNCIDVCMDNGLNTLEC